MRKVLSVLMITIMLFSTMMFPMSAENGEISVYLNGSKIEFDVSAQIIDGRTMVPMRKIFEELGATVDWNDSTQTAIGTKENTVVKFTINDYTMYKNESAIALDVPAQLINGRTLIPLRALSEAFDCQVGWDGNTNTISIISDFENYTMLYALGNRSNGFPSDIVDAQLTVGWYTEPVVTMYAPDGRTITVYKSEITSYKNVGWYETQSAALAAKKAATNSSTVPLKVWVRSITFNPAKNVYVISGEEAKVFGESPSGAPMLESGKPVTVELHADEIVRCDGYKTTTIKRLYEDYYLSKDNPFLYYPMVYDVNEKYFGNYGN